MRKKRFSPANGGGRAGARCPPPFLYGPALYSKTALTI